MNNSDHAARAKKPVLPPKNRSVARPKNRKQIKNMIANTTLFVFKDAMIPKIEKIKILADYFGVKVEELI